MSSTSFTRVTAEHSFHKVAAAVRDAVARGELKPGDLLPPQRALQDQFGVSRVTILEALRLLEADGLVKVQAGRTGGAIVLDPSRHSLSRALTFLLDVNQVDVDEIRELRTDIEVLAARLAAQRVTPAQVASLEVLLAQLDAVARQAERADGATPRIERPSSYLALDLEFHTAVAVASQNRLLASLMEVFYHQVIGHEVPVNASTQRRLNRSLRALLERGIKARSPDTAARWMARHMADSFAVIRAAGAVTAGTKTSRKRSAAPA